MLWSEVEERGFVRQLILSIFFLVISFTALATGDLWNAEYYKKHSAFQQSITLPVIGNFTFQGNEQILDVGCGDGKVSAKIASKVQKGEVVGIDVSQNMINAAKDNFSGITNLSFDIADACNFTLKKQFDLAFSFFVFHWVKDKLSALHCIKNVLKPGGKVFIIVVHPQNSMSTAFDHLKGDDMWKLALANRSKKFHAQTPDEYKTLLQNAGFKDVKIDIVTIKKTYETFDTFVNYIMTWLPFCVELEHKDCLKLADVLATDVYKQFNTETNNSLERTVPFLYVQATLG